MTWSWTRVGAIVRKELRDFRRNRFILYTMSIVPIILVALPMVQLFTIPAAAASTTLDTHIGLGMLYMLLIPAVVPSALAAYSVVGEREQGTLEAVLVTPIRREEFLVAKALAAFLPAQIVAYAVFGVFLACAALFAAPGVSAAIFHGNHVLIQVLFTPLLSGWSIWVGVAISTRSVDVRVAQQLSMFASLPPLALVSLMALNVITPTLALALGIAAAFIVVDVFGWRAVATLFDRERLVTGGRA